MNDPECRGVEVGDDYVFSIKTNLSDCGTIMVSPLIFGSTFALKSVRTC